MQIIKNSVAIALTVDEFIKILENNIIDELISVIITLDEGVNLASLVFGTKLDPNNMLSKHPFLSQPNNILAETEEDEKVYRLYENLLGDDNDELLF